MQNRIVLFNEFILAAKAGGDAGLATVNRYIQQNNIVAINAPDHRGITALIYAAVKGHSAIVTALLAKEGISINAHTPQGYTALIYAAGKGHSAIVTALLAKEGIAINAHTPQGYTALIWATLNGHTAIVNALLAKAGIAINHANQMGATALTSAAYKGHIAIVTALLSKEDIDINTADQGGNTPLIWAVTHGHTAIITALLPRLTLEEITKENNNHRTAAQEAELRGRHDILALIVAHVEALRVGGAHVVTSRIISLPLIPQERLEAIKFAGEVPADLVCPIGADGRVMSDPITVSSGETFERKNLRTYFVMKGNPETAPCPLTRKLIHRRELDYAPSKVVKSTIDAFVKAQEENDKQTKSVIQEVMNALVDSVDVSVQSLQELKQDKQDVRPAKEQYEDILLPPLNLAAVPEHQAHHMVDHRQLRQQEVNAELEQLYATKKWAEDFLRLFDAKVNLVKSNQGASSSSYVSRGESKLDRFQIADKRLAFFASQRQNSLNNVVIAASCSSLSINQDKPSIVTAQPLRHK